MKRTAAKATRRFAGASTCSSLHQTSISHNDELLKLAKRS
eukprot:COSAG02_NODE_46326_length_350_cov_0.474104_1_plen_39_part_01